MLTEAQRVRVLSLIRDVPDWPKPGVVFKDITPVLADPDAFAAVVDGLAAAGQDTNGRTVVDVVAGIEARGFILAAPVARVLGASFVPVRKAGKLPHETLSATYELEYGQETIEVHRDAFSAGDRVLVVDDVLATGGTIEATAGLITAAGAQVAAVTVLLALGFLGGRERVGSLDIRVLLDI